jgi:hypothetical protein
MNRWMTGFAVLCLMAASAPAQEAIVAVKVTPEKSVFKDAAWNKPIVIKSAEEAAKHFGKDALETLGKEVDFKKQIVLVFAWQGSGGDKLSYTVAESLPEQIAFSLKRGLTRDLRSHSHVYALRSNVRISTDGKDEPAKKSVRQLKGIKNLPTELGKPVIADPKDLEKAFSKEVQEQIKKDVDFTKEQIVGFGWKGSGSESLSFDSKEKDGKVTVFISILTPSPATTDLRMHGVWIVMPKGASWEMAKGQSPK